MATWRKLQKTKRGWRCMWQFHVCFSGLRCVAGRAAAAIGRRGWPTGSFSVSLSELSPPHQLHCRKMKTWPWQSDLFDILPASLHWCSVFVQRSVGRRPMTRTTTERRRMPQVGARVVDFSRHFGLESKTTRNELLSLLKHIFGLFSDSWLVVFNRVCAFSFFLSSGSWLTTI